MQQILKRLELIKTAIEIEDEEIIEMQIAKIRTLWHDEEVTQIVTLLESNDYGKASLDIYQYINKFTGVVIYEDKEIAGLKLELKTTEEKLQNLNTLKSEYLHDIDEFNTQYHLKLGDIIEKILVRQKELLEEELSAKVAAYEDLENAYEETKDTVEEIDETLGKLKEMLDEIDKNHPDYDVFRNTYEELQKEAEVLQEALEEQEEELHEAKQNLDDDVIFEERDEAKSNYEEFFKAFEELRHTAEDTEQLNESEKGELKKLFRQASRLCHPDLVVEELRQQAHEIMQELNDAYAKNDLLEVKRILLSLENDTEFTVSSDSVNDKKLLKKLIVNLKEKVSALEADIEEIKQDESFEVIQSIDNRESYFSELRKEFENKYEELKRSVSSGWVEDEYPEENPVNTVHKEENETTEDTFYFSTTTMANNFDIKARPFLFDRLLELNLLYRDDNKYKLTQEGIKFGGSYRENDEGGKWVVWKEYSLDKIIKDIKEDLGFVSAEVQKLTAHQDEVFDSIMDDINDIFNDDYLDDKISLSGSAGVGKTFVTIKIIERLQTLNYDVVVVAPTHKALSVITDNFKKYGIKKVESKTLHAFLNLKPKINEESGEKVFLPDADSKNTERVDVLVVDESSMIGRDLFGFINDELLSARVGAVLFVGDPYQLPPVNSEKNSVFELPQSYMLKQIIRQEKDSYIIGIATKIRDCIINKDFSHDIESFFTGNIEGLRIYTEKDDFLAMFYSDERQKWNEKNQIVTDYTNDSVNFYNKISRERYWRDRDNLTPKQLEVGDVVVFQDSYMTNKDIKFPNGSIVRISSCLKHHDEKYGLDYWLCTDAYGNNFKVMDNASNTKYMQMTQERVDAANEATRGFDKKNAWAEFYVLKERYANVKFNYASTIHKLQGSTYESVFIDIRKMTNLYKYSERTEKEFLYRLLYVAVTRASRDVVVLR